MRVSGIYQIQSKLKPERIYIGSSICISNRWNGHLKALRRNKHHSPKLQNHFNKYGQIDLQFSVLLSCPKEDLIKTEQFFIDSYSPFFNTCKIAGNTLGFKFSNESKKKISEKAKGRKYPNRRKMTDAEKQNLREKNLGKTGTKHTIESKTKLSIAFKGKPLSEETKRKFREGWEKRRIRLGKNKSRYLIKKYGT